jgi:hypothetical protein
MNWVILAGIVITGALSKARPRLAGWLGLVLTASILVWGLSIYAQLGRAVSFFGFPLPKMLFLLVIGLSLGASLAQLRKAYSG